MSGPADETSVWAKFDLLLFILFEDGKGGAASTRLLLARQEQKVLMMDSRALRPGNACFEGGEGLQALMAHRWMGEGHPLDWSVVSNALGLLLFDETHGPMLDVR